MISPGSATKASNGEMAETVALLAHCFKNIHRQRMRGIPILNNALRVRALGFRRWQDFWLGALVTPWFINLIMLPATESGAALPTVGNKLSVCFPAGNFSFIAAHEDAIGRFLTCSLLSPVLEIHDQQLAEDTAREALLAIMDPGHPDAAGDIRASEIERIWHGEQQYIDNSTVPVDEEEFIAADTVAQTSTTSTAGAASPDMPTRRELFRRLLAADAATSEVSKS